MSSHSDNQRINFFHQSVIKTATAGRDISPLAHRLRYCVSTKVNFAEQEGVGRRDIKVGFSVSYRPQELGIRARGIKNVLRVFALVLSLKVQIKIYNKSLHLFYSSD